MTVDPNSSNPNSSNPNTGKPITSNQNTGEPLGAGLRLTKESDLTNAQTQQICQLLTLSFPNEAAYFAEHSFWGSTPDYRLWLEMDDQILAHLAFSHRQIAVGSREVLIAGVGGVATHPNVRGQGFGKQLFTAFRSCLRSGLPADFALLGCLPEMIGFYEKSGFVRVRQHVRFLEPDDKIWVEHPGPNLIMAAAKTLEEWPKTGLIDLRGMPW
jgi:nodulation protein A